MGIGAPTMSEALKRLERLGLVEREAGTDRRRRTIGLTERGERALAAGSVLEPARLERLIGQLSERERAAAVRGLALLARAARRVAELEQRR
jgi:DNA-binding MarR family transcriptional regulator